MSDNRKLGYRPQPQRPENIMVQYVIYDHPKDYPDKYVCRRWNIDASGARPELEPFLMADNDGLQAMREDLRKRGLTRLPPEPGDDREILEVWL